MSRGKRWVVRSGDGETVGDILRRAREDASALGEGRVFVGRRRVIRADERVREGDEVVIGPASARAREAAILFDRGGLVACVKPAGIPTVPDHAGSSHALVATVARAVGARVEDLAVTSRLDREVSGVVIFARGAEAEARLRRAREEGRYARRYVAIACGLAAEIARGTWDAPIGRGKDPRHRAAFGPDAKPSTTRFLVVGRAGAFALLALEPETGRTHQIRVHAAHAGAPLLGDRDYGGPTRVTLEGGRVVSLARIALHAARVTVPGEGGAPVTAEAPIPPELAKVWRELGGEPEAWNTAALCALAP